MDVDGRRHTAVSLVLANQPATSRAATDVISHVSSALTSVETFLPLIHSGVLEDLL